MDRRFGFVLLFALLLGCTSQNDIPGGQERNITETSTYTYQNITVEQFIQLDKDDYFIIDVHIPEQEHIEGTDAVIPYNEISQNPDLLPEDKSTAIIVYCRS